MKAVVDASWGDRHNLVEQLFYTVALSDEQDFDFTVRYRGWNILHIAAYHGGGELIFHLCGKDKEAIDLQLASSINRPQGASVLMCIAYGKTCGLCTNERVFAQAGFKMVYRMTDEQLRYTDKKGCTALHYAAVHGVVDMVAALIERNIDLEALGVMNDEDDMDVGLAIKSTQWFDESKDEDGSPIGWQSAPPDTTPRTALECARMRHALQSKFIPAHANSQEDLRSVIKLLERASPQPDRPSAIPVVTTMLTVAVVPSGQTMNVATPKGAHPTKVPSGCSIGTFFQFELDEPIPVSDFRTWPREMVVSTTTTAMTTQTATDVTGDGLVDIMTTSTTQSVTCTVETKDVDGDGLMDGVVGLASA